VECAASTLGLAFCMSYGR